MSLAALSRNFLRQELPLAIAAAARLLTTSGAGPRHFVFGHEAAQKPRKRSESFAKRNERFRKAALKLLKSL
jgi:hypothetical protein